MQTYTRYEDHNSYQPTTSRKDTTCNITMTKTANAVSPSEWSYSLCLFYLSSPPFKTKLVRYSQGSHQSLTPKMPAFPVAFSPPRCQHRWVFFSGIFLLTSALPVVLRVLTYTSPHCEFLFPILLPKCNPKGLYPSLGPEQP